MTYNEFIKNIINTRGQWNMPLGAYWEGHHIVPKCLGGKGSTRTKHNNIIRLTAKEHFIAHKLLAEENPTCLKLQQAFWQMCSCLKNTNRDYLLLAEEYAEVREKIIKLSGKQIICIETGKIYNSIREAIADFPTSGGGISRCCRNLAKTAAGYHWAFISDKDKILELNNLYKGKFQINLENRNDKPIICIETQQIFNRVTDAVKQYGMGIACCLTGKAKKAYGYHWAYIEDIETRQKLSKYINKAPDLSPGGILNKKAILCVEKNIIFNSVKAAAEFAKVSSTVISRCANGKQKHAGSFTWKWISN